MVCHPEQVDGARRAYQVERGRPLRDDGREPAAVNAVGTRSASPYFVADSQIDLSGLCGEPIVLGLHRADVIQHQVQSCPWSGCHSAASASGLTSCPAGYPDSAALRTCVASREHRKFRSEFTRANLARSWLNSLCSALTNFVSSAPFLPWRSVLTRLKSV